MKAKVFSWADYKSDQYIKRKDARRIECKRVAKLFLYIVFVQVMYVAITTAMFFYTNPCISQDVLGWSYTECSEDERQQLGF